MKIHLQKLMFGLLLCFGLSAQAALSPVGLTIVPPVQFPPSDYNVTGLRLGIVGSHRDVSGIDVGVLGNITNQKFNGLAVSGLFNYTGGEANIYGMQLAGGVNYNKQKTTVVGIQAGLLSNVNIADSDVYGVMLAAANVAAHTDVVGVQVGIYNRAKEVYGLQLGLVNVADSLHGIQIGLANFHHTGLFYVSPVLNVGF